MPYCNLQAAQAVNQPALIVDHTRCLLSFSNHRPLFVLMLLVALGIVDLEVNSLRCLVPNLVRVTVYLVCWIQICHGGFGVAAQGCVSGFGFTWHVDIQIGLVLVYSIGLGLIAVLEFVLQFRGHFHALTHHQD